MFPTLAGRRSEKQIAGALCGLFFLGGFLAPPEALAHAKLIRSQPIPFEVLTTPPIEVSLWFNERLEDEFNSIEVTDETGRHVENGMPQVNPQDRTNLVVRLGKVFSGSYEVRWRILSLDGHPARGRFVFTVK